MVRYVSYRGQLLIFVFCLFSLIERSLLEFSRRKIPVNVQETQKIQGIQVISRAADILRVLGSNSGGLSLGQIARQVELPRSTVQRIVSALIHEGFVATDGTNGGIRLGGEIRNLAEAHTFDLRGHFRPLLEEISSATFETVDLAILEGRQMRFIDQIEGSQRLRTVSRIGDTFPLTTTANGKAALAALSATSAESLIKRELEENGSSAGKFERLVQELDLISKGALARDVGEHTEEVSALGFAVHGPNGEIAAVSVPVPSGRFRRIEAELSRQLKQVQTTK